MYNNGLDEDVKTPLEMMNEPKLLIHHRNEIPLFLGPDSSIATVKSKRTLGIKEVFVPLQVSKLTKCLFNSKLRKLLNSIKIIVKID